MKLSKNDARKVRHLRIRKKIIGTSTIPRLNVFRSNTNFYAQLIDDQKHHTLASASTKKLTIKNKANKAAAQQVGIEIANQAKALKIKKVVFDRSGYLYHGRVQAFADAARETGLQF